MSVVSTMMRRRMEYELAAKDVKKTSENHTQSNALLASMVSMVSVMSMMPVPAVGRKKN